MWPMLIVAALSAAEKADASQRQTKLNSVTQRYSPWTKMGTQGTGEVQDPNTAGTVSQALGSYYGQNQKDAQAAAQQKLMDAQIRALDRGQGNPWSGLRGSGSTDLYGNGAYGNVG